MRSAALVLAAVLSSACDTEGEKLTPPGQVEDGSVSRSPTAAPPLGGRPDGPPSAGPSASPPPWETATTVSPAPPASSPARSAAPEAAAEAAPSSEHDGLRRNYGVADMKYNPCVRVQGTTIQGRGCPASILVYGPYVDVPANSEIEFSFELQGPTRLGVYSDMSAQVGKRPLGALVPQQIPANEKRKLGYRINMATADVTVEARIWLHALGPVDFDITNLNLIVR